MERRYKFNPDYSTKPGESIIDCLLNNMSKDINIDIEILQNIIDGKIEITMEYSNIIGKYLRIDPLFLYNRQLNHNKRVKTIK